jgi:hypothetical protein
MQIGNHVQILAVLSGRAPQAQASSDTPPPKGYVLQTPLTAISFIITTADASSDDFVAYAVNVGTQTIDYSIAGRRARLPSLMEFMSSTIQQVITGVIIGPVPGPGPGGGDPWDPKRPGPGPDHPAFALAMIDHDVIRSIERLLVLR